MKKIVWIFLLFPFVLLSVMSQTVTDSLFQTVAKHLDTFRSHTPREYIYIHQDRTIYSAGETIWFKAYQFTDPEQSVKSGVLYVDIIDGLNQRITDTQWKLEQGSAHGSIVLPDTLKSGNFQLRAYTQWMQNYGPEELFTREIRIISKVRDPWEVETDISISGKTITAILQFRDRPQTELGYRLRINNEESERYSLPLDEKGEVLLDIDLPEDIVLSDMPYFLLETPVGIREYPITSSSSIQFSLFPEGGYLVSGLLSKIAFKVNDRQGKGLNASGVVIDEDGNEVRRFQTQHLGHGSFSFIPEEGKKYTAILDDILIRKEFPEVLPSGLVMAVAHRSDRLRISIRHNFMATSINNSLYLTVHQNGLVWFNARVDITSPMSVVDILHDKLASGIFTITLYDENYNAFAERLCLVDFPDKLPVQLWADKSGYGKREKVTVELETGDGMPMIGGDFSVAVVKSDLDDIQSRDNLYSYYFLSNELKGKVENPYSYFTAPDSIAIINMDLLLLTQGWRRYSWQDMMNRKYPEFRYYAEPGLTFSGKVHQENEKQKEEDIEVTAVFRHKELNDIQSFHPAEGGDFIFTNYDFRDTAEVIISAIYKKRRALNISVKELVRARPGYYYYGGISEKSEEQINTNDLLFYNPTESLDQRIHELGEINVTARAKRLKTYNRYHVVLHEEAFVARSYETKRGLSYNVGGGDGHGSLGAIGILYSVPGVIVSGNGSDIRVAGSGGMSGNFKNSMARKVDPVYILDGNRTTYADLRSLSPSLIERVEVLNPASAMMYDSGAWGGAIIFHTKSWEGMVYSVPTKTLTYKFAGYNQSKEFYSPDYGGTREYIDPDNRNTLYWQPNIKIDQTGKAEFDFYSSDEKGEYLIFCEGRSADGQIGIASYLIQIR